MSTGKSVFFANKIVTRLVAAASGVAGSRVGGNIERVVEAETEIGIDRTTDRSCYPDIYSNNESSQRTPVGLSRQACNEGHAMSMAIELRTESGTVLTTLVDDDNQLGFAFDACDPAEYPLLGYVDPFYDTYFNTVQMKGLIPELQKLAGIRPDLARGIAPLLALAERCASEVHCFLVFVGD